MIEYSKIYLKRVYYYNPNGTPTFTVDTATHTHTSMVVFERWAAATTTTMWKKKRWAFMPPKRVCCVCERLFLVRPSLIFHLVLSVRFSFPSFCCWFRETVCYSMLKNKSRQQTRNVWSRYLGTIASTENRGTRYTNTSHWCRLYAPVYWTLLYIIWSHCAIEPFRKISFNTLGFVCFFYAFFFLYSSFCYLCPYFPHTHTHTPNVQLWTDGARVSISLHIKLSAERYAV